MQMKPDEIVVRYRQAKDKTEQLKILAELNACTVDGIINILCEHGGYNLRSFSRQVGKMNQEASEKAKKRIPYKKPEVIPEPLVEPEKDNQSSTNPETEKIPPVIRRALEAGLADLEDAIDTRRNRIEELEAEIVEFEKDISSLKAWKEQHI